MSFVKEQTNVCREAAPSSIEENRAPTTHCLKVLRLLLTCRRIDDKMNKLVRQNKGATFYLSGSGHELIGILSALALTPKKDWGLPYYRDRGFAIGLGCSPTELLGAFLARKTTNHSGGRMMPDHFSHKELRIPCQSSVVGSQFLQAVGIAKGAQLSGKNEVVYVSGGDGSTSQGDFHEALNYATLHSLSVIFVIQDNGWAISVPLHEQRAGGSLASMARGYPGLACSEVDGCSYEEISKALSQAVERGRSLHGPTLIVAKVPRLGAHSNSDDQNKYRSEKNLKSDRERDPLLCYKKWLIDMGLIDEEGVTKLDRIIKEEIDLAATQADALPPPPASEIDRHLFVSPICGTRAKTDSAQKKDSKTNASTSIVMMDALNHALQEEMERDPGVIVFGQDVAHEKGGVFGVTRGLTKKYGQHRCFNTPLAESTIVGTAIGLSIHSQWKPVAEIQFADYLWTGINQLFNELASYHYRSCGEWNCPLVLRMPYGGYIQGGPYHSQSIEAFLAHCPGLIVVIPSHAADAKMLLKTSIRSPNPVVFLEHKALYRQRAFAAREEPAEEELLPFGKAAMVRKGEDVTVVCWGLMVSMTFDIATKLNREGISVEILDPRTISPFDIDAVKESVAKTGKLLIVHEAPLFCGFGAEIAAQIGEQSFDSLDAPIVRVGGRSCVVPYAKNLEEQVLPQKGEIENAIRQLASY